MPLSAGPANNMNQKNLLSAIIIAKNEAPRIERCLSTVGFADERIVVDNGSADDTARLAKKTAHVVKSFSSDFSHLRNLGARKAKGMWLLYIDADEQVSDELKKEILEKINDEGLRMKGYFITRQNYYLGTKWPTRDKMIRLIKKEALQQWTGSLHEHPEIAGVVGQLEEPLIHDTHRSLSDMIAKTNEWSDIEAKLRFDQHHPQVTWWRLLRVMLTGFWQSFIREGGWKAGVVGWIESLYQGFSMFITYAKLWELQKKLGR